ncbi:MAG: PilZ domain-containing protein [Planctomycetota bacterium]|nr:PilZ domain-containing protein [Planctomycetota bacterium]
MVRDDATAASSDRRRAAPRFWMDAESNIVVTAMHPGGSMTSSESIMLNISGGGVGLLFPGFLHNGTECAIHIRTTDGEPMILIGTVVWCRLLAQSVHSLGLRFTPEIDVRNYIPSSQWLEQMSNSDEHVNAELAGRILLIGFDESELQMLHIFLQGTSFALGEAGFDGAALDSIRRESFDILMIDADNLTDDPSNLVGRIRGEGSREPVLVVSSNPPSKTVSSLSAVETLRKPLQNDVILAVLRDLLLTQITPFTGTRPICSELSDLESKMNAVNAYIENCNGYSETIHAAIGADNALEALRAAQSIYNTASGFGFPVLGEAAAQAITAINASGSAKEAAPALRTLIRIVGRLKSPVVQDEIV